MGLINDFYRNGRKVFFLKKQIPPYLLISIQYIEYSLRLVPLQGSDIAENPHWRLDLLNPRGLDFGGSGP